VKPKRKKGKNDKDDASSTSTEAPSNDLLKGGNAGTNPLDDVKEESDALHKLNTVSINISHELS